MKSGNSSRGAVHVPDASTADAQLVEQQERARQKEPQFLKDLLEKMLLIRRFEEKSAEMYTLGKIGGFCHLYIGQEAVAVGAIATLEPEDAVLCSYREHGHALVRGMDPGPIMAELFGKRTGCSKGKGGSMHLFDPAIGFLGGHGIVGGQIPLAAGVAFAAKYLNQSRVTLCFFGEAAVNIGSFHESLNLAQLWKLPVVFICENNEFGMGTPILKTSAIRDLSEKACSYDMARAVVDGMDVLSVYDGITEAVERARKEDLPTLIEARTYRFMGHSMSDPAHGTYRTREELAEHRQRDPIKRFSSTLESLGIINQEYIDDLDVKIREIVDQAVTFADESPDPTPEDLTADVYLP
ncbi:MAG: pyruvate dehydrogenase (acetyl-transferring) E1 component subunit alpha [Acidobacteria bacterium]|nr:MAG: pyruvate dehydrogenase (acetyl-transferring) E1 component subunit alpha [Acidobacteriota bacterium]